MLFYCFRFENSIQYVLVLDHNALDKREESVLRQYLSGEKIIQNMSQNRSNPLMIMTCYLDKKLIKDYKSWKLI